MRKKQVLIVDDDAEIVLLVGTIAELEGYVVRSARNGADALNLLRQSYTPDLIVLDLMMPVMDGWTFSRELRALADKQNIPVLVLSGVHDVHATVADLPVDGHIAKPFDYDELRGWLAHFLGSEMSSER